MARFPARSLVTAVAVTYLAIGCLWIALRLPFFHHIDEAMHVDYLLRLVDERSPNPGGPLLPETIDFALEHAPEAFGFYLSSPVDLEYERGELARRISYQAYQPRLPYVIASWIYAVARQAGLSLEASLLILRGLAALLVIAGRLILLRTIWKVDRNLGFASVPLLCLWLPVDLLRISNDAPLYLFSCLFFSAFIPLLRQATPATACRAGTFLVIAGLCKVTGFLMLVPAVVLAAVHLRGRLCIRYLFWLLFLPMTAFAMLVSANKLAFGTWTGTGHLAAHGIFDPPTVENYVWHALIPGVFHIGLLILTLFTPETLVGGSNGASLSPVLHISTFFAAGVFLAVSAAVLPSKEENLLRHQGDRATLIICFLVAVLAALCTTWIQTLIGRVAFQNPRHYMPIEGFAVFCAVYGWVLVTDGRERLRRGIWLLAACLLAPTSLIYLVSL